MFRALRAAAATVFLIAAAAHAEPPSRTVQAPAGFTDLEFARLLLRAGKPEHARAFLQQARPSGDEEWTERLFLLGRIEMRLGLPRQAAERFEEILTRRPELTRVRLELARAYYAAGWDDKAKRHFGSSLGERLPSTVAATVEDFLRHIDARKRWSYSVSAAILPESNPARRTASDQVRIGGVPFTLSEDARESSGVGALVSTGVSYSPVIADDLRGALAASTAAKLYRQSDWNDVSVSGEAGVTRLFDAGSVSGGMRVGHRRLGDEPFSRSLGPWTRLRWRPSKATVATVSISAERVTHHSRSRRDGWRIVFAPGLRYALDGQTSIEAEPVFETNRARAGHEANRLLGVGATISRAFEGGLSLSVSPSFEIRRYRAPNPLFGIRREDRGLRLAVRLLHRALRYKGFAPYLGYSIERNRSNIAIHAYRNHGAIVGVSRKF